MQDLIVLGQIPGTNWHFGFYTLVYLLELVLIIYFVKTYHPKKLKGLEKRLRKLRRAAKKLVKRPRKTIKAYRKRAAKRLHHFRNDVLGPKLKLLK